MTAPALLPDRLVDVDLHVSGETHELWRWMRRHAPVYRHEPADLPLFWSVTRYDDVNAVYHQPDLFSSAEGVLLRPISRGGDPGGGLTLALTDPPRHRDLRAMVAGRFNERCARSLEDVIKADARSVIAAAIDNGECDFAHDISARLSIYLICRLLGIPDQDRELLLRWTVEAFEEEKPLAAHPQVMRYFIELMYTRMDDPADDAMSMLVTGRAGGAPLTETEIVLNCENLVGATENAGLSMAAGMLAFLDHPQQWQRLREDRGLVPSAVEEMLRWTSSASHSMRTTTRPVELAGQQIGAGERVVVWLPSANHDESAFTDPYRFDIGRRPNRHLALGTGEHYCVGATMARHQMRILFTELLEMAERIEQTGPVVPVRSLAVSGPAHLPVRITAR
jgi:cytochrome P450